MLRALNPEGLKLESSLPFMISEGIVYIHKPSGK